MSMGDSGLFKGTQGAMAAGTDAPIGFDEMPPEDAIPETAGADWERNLMRSETARWKQDESGTSPDSKVEKKNKPPDSRPEIVIEGGSTGASTTVTVNGKRIDYLDAVRFESVGGGLSKVTLTFVPKSVTIRVLGELMERGLELIHFPSERIRGERNRQQKQDEQNQEWELYGGYFQ